MMLKRWKIWWMWSCWVLQSWTCFWVAPRANCPRNKDLGIPCCSFMFTCVCGLRALQRALLLCAQACVCCTCKLLWRFDMVWFHSRLYFFSFRRGQLRLRCSEILAAYEAIYQISQTSGSSIKGTRHYTIVEYWSAIAEQSDTQLAISGRPHCLRFFDIQNLSPDIKRSFSVVSISQTSIKGVSDFES